MSIESVLCTNQRWLWAVPDEMPVLCDFGGAGAGRTNGAFARAARFLTKYPGSRGVYIRQIIGAIRPAFDECQRMWRRMGYVFSVNQTYYTLTLPNGSYLEFGPLEDETYFYQRWHGGSFQLLIIDELSTWDRLELPKLLFSRWRGEQPCAAMLLSNPGKSGYLLHKHFIGPSNKARGPFKCEFVGGFETLVRQSTYKGNEFLDPEKYLAALRASCTSEAHFKRMALGIFTAVESSLHEISAAHCVDWPRFDPRDYPAFRYHIGYDHGSVAPWCAVWFAKAQRDAIGPDGTEYATGSYVAFWETHSANPEQGYVKATRVYTVEEIAKDLQQDAETLNFAKVPPVHADDAVTARTGVNPIIAEFQRQRIEMRPAGKGRVKDAILRVNQLLRGAVPPEMTESSTPLFRRDRYVHSRPGLFLTQDVPYFKASLENATSDPRDADALNPKFMLKHAWDAGANYGLIEAVNDRPRTTVIQGAI